MGDTNIITTNHHHHLPANIFTMQHRGFIVFLGLISALSIHCSGKLDSANEKAASPLINCGCQCSSLTFRDANGVVQGNCLTVDRVVDRLNMNMGRLHWDDCWSHGDHRDHWSNNAGTEGRAGCRGGTGLVGPGVVGEPLGGDEVLAGGVSLVNITPLSSSAIHSQTVALNHSIGVSEGQAAALTPTVDQRRGRLLVSRVQLLTAVDGKGADESEEDDKAAVLHGDGSA